jgi:hypothetical protein
LKKYLKSPNVAIIGAVGDAGCFLSLLIGWFYVYFGQSWTSILGFIFLTGGYLGAYFALERAPYIALFCVLYFFIGQGSQAMAFICMTVNSGNFPVRNRGSVMGILLAFFALSAIAWTLLYKYVMDYDLETLYLSLGSSSGVAAMMALLLVADISPVRRVSLSIRPRIAWCTVCLLCTLCSAWARWSRSRVWWPE